MIHSDTALRNLRELTDRAVNGDEYLLAADVAQAFRELDAHLSAGGTPPEEWREGPDAVPADVVPTLGDIYNALRPLMERGVTHESVEWVLAHQFPREDGTPYVVPHNRGGTVYCSLHGVVPEQDKGGCRLCDEGEVPEYAPPSVSALITEVSSLDAVVERLEYLRGELRGERISQGELADLQSLASYIDPGDTELLEAAGVPEHTDLHALVVEYMTEDLLSQYEDETKAGDLGMLIDSIVPGACDRMASHAVGMHMTPVEIVVWAGARWEHCLSVMRGETDDDGEAPVLAHESERYNA